MADKMKDYSEPVVVTKYGSHKFRFYVIPSNATIEFTVDGEDTRNKIKELSNGKVVFKQTLELFFGDDIEFVDAIRLDDMDYTQLRAEQNLLKAALKKQNDRTKDWTLDNKTRKELLSMVDSHKKRIHTKVRRSANNKTREKYVVHTFRIGSENIRMIERKLEDRVIINPDYKVQTDYRRAGGIGEQEGELLVWKYYFETDEVSSVDPDKKKGFWETAREMRYSEQICYEIIRRYGYFSSSPEKSR